jgi:hypothetical protein
MEVWIARSDEIKLVKKLWFEMFLAQRVRRFDLGRVAELATESIVPLLFEIANGWTQAQRVSKVQWLSSCFVVIE